ncbi:acyl carrier protein [Roseovarius sp.]|uniref:acyl carrier protein n=1 Tax=Roseovarius sp. TaxID=1486281 RepID=UPI003517820A
MTLEDVITTIAETGVKPDMENFDAERSFEENGIDSLDTYTVLLALEEKTGVALEEVDLEKINTASALRQYIAANAS